MIRIKLWCILIASSVILAGCQSDIPPEMDEVCDRQQSVAPVTYLKGGSSGGGGGRGGGGGSSARGSQGGGGSSAKGTNSTAKPKPSAKSYGSYTPKNGYYIPYMSDDGSYGFWDDTDQWVECEEDDGKWKAKRKR